MRCTEWLTNGNLRHGDCVLTQDEMARMYREMKADGFDGWDEYESASNYIGALDDGMNSDREIQVWEYYNKLYLVNDNWAVRITG